MQDLLSAQMTNQNLTKQDESFLNLSTNFVRIERLKLDLLHLVWHKVFGTVEFGVLLLYQEREL